jgi:hypothetical protein
MEGLLSKISAEELEAIKVEIRPSVIKEVSDSIRTEAETEIAKIKDSMRVDNDLLIKRSIKEWQDKQESAKKPLTPEELQILLNQEYVTFKVSVRKTKEDDSIELIELTLGELSQNKEEEFYKLAKDFVKENITSLGGNAFKLTEGDLFEKLGTMMDVFDPVFSTMAKACVICLNPDGKHKWLTTEWIQSNMNSFRIMNVIKAQTEINKLRDFFSELFQTFQSQEPTNPAEYR